MSAAKGPAIISAILHDFLKDDFDITAIFGSPPRLYDYPPDDPIYPYLSYGTVRSEDRSGDDVEILSHMVTLHVWSRYSGRAEILDLLTTLSNRLEVIPKAQGDYRIVGLNILYTDVFRARDNRTQHGLIRLSIQTETLVMETQL
jgi:hypothetical protein